MSTVHTPSPQDSAAEQDQDDAIPITLNGTVHTIPAHMSISELINYYKLTKKNCAVELDKTIVPREQYAHVRVHRDAAIEIVHFVGGG